MKIKSLPRTSIRCPGSGLSICHLPLGMGLLLLLLAALPVAAKLNVVATTPDFAAIAAAVGGDEVSITTLAKPTEDPHFVDAKPSFIVKLNRADAIIEGTRSLLILLAAADQAHSHSPVAAHHH